MAQKITLNELRRLVKQVINENQAIDQKENLKWFFLFNGDDKLYRKMEKGEVDNIEIEKKINHLKDFGIEYNPDTNYEEEYVESQDYEQMANQEHEDYYSSDYESDYNDDYDSGMSHRDQSYSDRSDYAREKAERGEWDDEQAAEYRAGA